MTRYQLIAPKEQEVASGETVRISQAKLLDLGVQKMINFLVQNGRAVKGSVKPTKYNQKFSLVWQNAETKLFHQQSYLPFIASDGSIRTKAMGAAKVTVEAPQASE